MTEVRTPYGYEPTPVPHDTSRRHDLMSSLVLAAAIVLTAWCAFQAATFLSSSSRGDAAATALRIESARLSNQAAAFSEIDANLWVDWVRAVLDERAAGDTRSFSADGQYTPVEGTQSAFYFNSFRKEMVPAFEAWLATRPFDGGDGPPVPFVMPQYRLRTEQEADAASARAEEVASRSTEDSDVARDYVLLGVVAASALALSGLAMRFTNARIRGWMIALAGATILCAFVVALLSPMDV